MRRNYIYIVLVLFVFGSCSKDLGNYVYTEINTYTVSGINTGTGISRNYDVLMGQTLTISPILESKFEDANPDLSYYWIVEGDTVSKERDLDYFIELPIKIHQSKFVLVDNKTKMQYTTVFALNVTSPFGRGYFFLAEDEEHNTILSFKAVQDSVKTIVNTDNLDDRKFGKYPQNMAGVKRFKSGPNDYRWEVFILSKEGQYPGLFADLTSYSPLRYFTKDAFMGTSGTEFEFNPTHVALRSTNVTYFINKGRIAFFDGSNLYRPSQLFDNSSVNSSTPRLFVAMYDEASSQPNKGSILVYDVNTKTIIHQFEHVTGKIVDIFLGE